MGSQATKPLSRLDYVTALRADPRSYLHLLSTDVFTHYFVQRYLAGVLTWYRHRECPPQICENIKSSTYALTHFKNNLLVLDAHTLTMYGPKRKPYVCPLPFPARDHYLKRNSKLYPFTIDGRDYMAMYTRGGRHIDFWRLYASSLKLFSCLPVDHVSDYMVIRTDGIMAAIKHDKIRLFNLTVRQEQIVAVPIVDLILCKPGHAICAAFDALHNLYYVTYDKLEGTKMYYFNLQTTNSKLVSTFKCHPYTTEWGGCSLSCGAQGEYVLLNIDQNKLYVTTRAGSVQVILREQALDVCVQDEHVYLGILVDPCAVPSGVKVYV